MVQPEDIKFLLLCSALISIGSLSAQVPVPPKTKVAFKKIQLLDKYVTEGASSADMDMDGQVDVVAGPLWWKGPEFKESFVYAPVTYFPITGPGLEGYAYNFFSFSGNFDTDNNTDILWIGVPGNDSEWFQNPGIQKIKDQNLVPYPNSYKAVPNVSHESPGMIDIIGDETKELLAFSNGHLILGIPGEPWQILPISTEDNARFPRFSHGLGAADINMDGLVDVIEKRGWWQQPENWDKTTTWEYHPFAFSQENGGAQMFAFDVDGDGDNDVVTAINAHGYGLSWFEQLGDEGKIGFFEHQIMTDKAEDNPYGVCFSQLHAMACADIDNDGIQDIVTGKCFYAHNGLDPGAEDPAVLYWFRTVRHADGSVQFIPYLIDDNSGVGRQISVGDLNNDNKMDIVVGNKKGVYVFIQE